MSRRIAIGCFVVAGLWFVYMAYAVFFSHMSATTGLLFFFGLVIVGVLLLMLDRMSN